VADLEDLNVYEWGKTVELACKKDGVVQSLAAYSTDTSAFAYTVKFWSPSPVQTLTFDDSDGAGNKSTDGLDGVVSFACSSTKYFDRAGEWTGQIWIIGTTTRIKSDKFSVAVGE